MAQYQEFTIDQGSDISIELHMVDSNDTAKNLSGYNLAAKMKKTFNSDSATSFVPVITSSTGGTATISLTHAVTNALKSGRYVYDVELSHTDSSTGNTIVERILEGRIQITPSVTT